MGNYNDFERITPEWVKRWPKKIIKLGSSAAIIIPKPLLNAAGLRVGRIIGIGWVRDAETGKQKILIDPDGR